MNLILKRTDDVFFATLEAEISNV